MSIFKQKRKKWLEKWMAAVFSTYPAESVIFFKDTKDAFANPVGATVKTGLTEVYDVLVAPRFNHENAKKALGPVVKLRAVQEFTAAEALGFIFDLKTIMRSGPEDPETEISDIFARIDQLMLMAFDLYMENKKTIYSLRASQARDNVRQLLIKKDLICELPEIDPELAK